MGRPVPTRNSDSRSDPSASHEPLMNKTRNEKQTLVAADEPNDCLGDSEAARWSGGLSIAANSDMHNYFLFSTVKCNSVMKIVYLFATIGTSSCFLLIFRLIKEFPAAR